MARPRGKKPCHIWKENDRVLLCMLRQLCYSRRDIGLIWNTINQRTLSLEGFASGVPITTLDAQYNEIKGGGKGYATYDDLLHLNEQGLKEQYGQLYDSISAAARHLDVVKNAQVTRPRDAGQRRVPTRHRRRAASVPTTISFNPSEEGDVVRVTNPFLLEHMFTTEDEEPQQEYDPDHNSHDLSGDTLRRLASTTPYPPTLRVARKNEEENQKSRLVLLFRAFEPVHGFRARRFAQNDNIPAPPVVGTVEFKALVWPHLHRSIYCNSSFLSLTSSSKDALRRIELEFSKDGTERHFAIFSFDAVLQSAERRYGAGNGFYHVRSFFEKDEISSLPDGYTGPSEWLAYGSIDCAPIGVISCDQAIKLAKALRRLKRQDTESLNDIRECLSDIPSLWKQVVAFELLNKYVGKKLPKTCTPQFTRLMCELYKKSESIDIEADMIVQRYIDHQWVESNETTSQQEYEEEEPSVQSDECTGRTSTAVGPLNNLTDREISEASQLVARQNRARSYDSDEIVETDWDLYEDEAVFASEFPSASRKKTYTPYQSRSSPDRVMMSIESVTSPEQFVAQLISSASRRDSSIASLLQPMHRPVSFRPSKTRSSDADTASPHMSSVSDFQTQVHNNVRHRRQSAAQTAAKRPQRSFNAKNPRAAQPAMTTEDTVIDLTLADDEIEPKLEPVSSPFNTFSSPLSHTLSSSPLPPPDPQTPTPTRPPIHALVDHNPLIPTLHEIKLNRSHCSTQQPLPLESDRTVPLVDYPDSDLEVDPEFGWKRF